MRIVLAAAAMGLLTACASTDPGVPQVEVTRNADTWRIHYSFPAAVDEVRFFRAGQVFRCASWKADPGTWSVDGDREVLSFDQPRRSFTIELASDLPRRDKGYDFIAAYTDGARLLYTGFLMVAPRHEWVFRSGGETVVLLDQIGESALRWKPVPEPEDGTYVYFGREKPVRGARMNVIVDRGLPDWIESDVMRVLPQQFDDFAAQLRTELPFRPLIFVTWSGGESRGRTFKGGTLERLMVVTLHGRQWVTETEDSRRALFHHLAHESFHFWDGELFEPAEGDANWLSESAAEYMALLATRKAGMIDGEGVQRSLDDYAKRCKRFSKNDSASFYTCGVLVQAIADRAAGGRIVDVYRKTFAQHYTTARFLEALRAFAPDESAVDRVERLIRTEATSEELRSEDARYHRPR